MTISLIFDTETTGLPTSDFKDPLHGRILQFCGMLYEHDDKTELVKDNKVVIEPFSVFYTYINPEVESHPKALAVHRITSKRVKELGLPRVEGTQAIWDYIDIADTIVAHNINFDKKILQNAFHFGDLPDYLEEKTKICTMLELRDIMRLTPKRYGQFQNPSLKRGYNYIFGREFEGKAHDALVDTKAASDIYFALLDMKKIRGIKK